MKCITQHHTYTYTPHQPTSKTVITLALECSGSPPLSLMPGQSRPLKFHISDFENSTTLSLKISYMKHRNPEISSPIHVTAAIKLNHKPNIYQPHIFTFLHSSGIVSYAAIRPPSEKAPCTPSPANQIPILLSLHGAGVDVRWGEAQAAYDALPDLCAWVLLPQGVTLWSGDDWRKEIGLACIARAI